MPMRPQHSYGRVHLLAQKKFPKNRIEKKEHPMTFSPHSQLIGFSKPTFFLSRPPIF
jgi:hypothetical protein